jgi:site-specific recombinase XerD
VTNLSDSFLAYRICAQAEGKSQRSIDWIIAIVGYFNEFLGNLNIEAITADDLIRFIIALQQRQAFTNHRFTKPQNRPLSPESVASYTRAIKTFFSFLEREELLTNNPMRRVKLPKTPKKNMPVFNEKDLRKLLAQPNKKSNEGYRNYVIMLTLLDTGIRVAELGNLKTLDVDLANGYLRVMGKGAKERYVPLGAELSKSLLKYQLARRPEGCDSFFVVSEPPYHFN